MNLSIKGIASSHLPPAASPKPRTYGYHHRQAGSALRILSAKGIPSSGLPAEINIEAMKRVASVFVGSEGDRSHPMVKGLFVLTAGMYTPGQQSDKRCVSDFSWPSGDNLHPA